ncbi:tail fiber assembly protein [Enterobacter cloacae]|nr:tail fiber assembly protein [Enterobacter cloacae]
MNNYVFSATTLAFYPLEMKVDYENSGSWPDDGVEVSDEVYNEFLTPPSGKMRGAHDGLPCWVDIPPPTHNELVAAADAEKERRIIEANDYINSKQWPGKAAMGRLKDSEKAQYNAWLDYLDALDAVDTSKVPDITWPTPPAA